MPVMNVGQDEETIAYVFSIPVAFLPPPPIKEYESRKKAEIAGYTI